MIQYFNLHKTLSYNALFNFIIGERGVGKSYSAGKFVVQRFLDHDEQFVYVRRYKSELGKDELSKFFNPLIENEEFGDHEISLDHKTFKIDGMEMGYAIPLTTASTKKSVPFERVKTIIFDEFLLAKGNYHYLKDEVRQFLDLYETIARLRDVRVLFLGNATSVVNPYFTELNLTLPHGSEFKLFKNNTVLVHYIKNLQYRAAKKQTRFGQLIEGTSYSKYAIDNEFLNDNKNFIQKKSGTCFNYSVIQFPYYSYGIWINKKTGIYFISEDYDINNPCIVSTDHNAHNEQSVLTSLRTSKWFRPIIHAYELGNVRFENQHIKQDMIKIFHKCIGV